MDRNSAVSFSVRRWPAIRVVLLTVALAPLAPASGPRLMPWPAKVGVKQGSLAIDAAFTIAATAYSGARLDAAIGRIRARIARQTGVQLSASPTERPSLAIECRSAGPALPSLGENETYILDVDPSGARLKSETVTGALRGLETFTQLLVAGQHGFEVPAIHIEDRPRFPWRGLMIDVSRHWMPLAAVERNLDGMAAVKMNVFHWHLTDDQGFRVQSQRFPQLQTSGSDGLFYTQDQIRGLIAYAADRGIRVIPEFDMPGHTTSWMAGMPQLGSAPGPYRIERSWGIFEPTMDPSREETYAFLDSFIGEMAALFPDPFFHIGGDEIDDAQWKRSATIQKFAREHDFKTSHDLHAYFNRRVQAILRKYGKTMIGWDEVLNPGMDENTVIQSWRGQQSLADAARKGYRGVLSFGYYLDHVNTASFYYANDPLSGPAAHLTPAEESKILGGEACMWSEYVSPQTIDSRIWPSAAAIAERLWSAATLGDADNMYQRLEHVSLALAWAGVRHRSNYEPMLAEIAAGDPPPALRALADAVEALGIEGRRDARKYTSAVALDRLVDAARTESERVRHLERCAAALQSGSNVAELNIALSEWRDNSAALAPLANRNSLVQELIPISKELSQVGAIGLQALKYIAAGRAAPEAWVAAQRRLLTAYEKPGSEVVLAAVRPVQTLLDAASKAATQ